MNTSVSRAAHIASLLVPALLTAGCAPGETADAPVRTDDPPVKPHRPDSGSAGDPVSIRLRGASGALTLPPPSGANRVLTVTIDGAARSVWLAPSAESMSRVALTRVDANEYQVNLYGREVLDLLREAETDGEFRVFAEMSDGRVAPSIAVRYTIRELPKQLAFPWDRATTTVDQHSRRELPGSRGNLYIELGDITAGQVLISVVGPDGKPFVGMTSARQGDAVPVPLEESRYMLVVDRLVNVLAGPDHAILSLVAADAWEGDKIDRLLETIEHSDAAFLRNDQELTGLAFAEHLRRKLGYLNRSVITLDHFMNQVASRSWSTGVAYRVRLAGGEVIDVRTWLRAEGSAVFEPARKDGGAPP